MSAYKRHTQPGPRQLKLPRLHCLFSPLTFSTQNQRHSIIKNVLYPGRASTKMAQKTSLRPSSPSRGRRCLLDSPPTDSYVALDNQRRINNFPTKFDHLFAHRHKRPPTTTHEKCLQRTATCCSSYLVAIWGPYKDMAEGLVQPSFTLSRGVPMKAIKVMGSDAFLRYKHSQILTPFIQAGPEVH